MIFSCARAMEKIPEEALPWAIGVSATLQVRPESGERKTRAAGPPVPKKISSPESKRQVLLAANAPSPGRAAGMLPLGSGFQCWPSVVLNRRNLPSMGSLSAKQCVSERQVVGSRKNSLRLSVYCSFQISPPSVVLYIREFPPSPFAI